MAPGSEDVRRKLEKAQRHLEQLKGEEEARKNRIALRKNRQVFQPKKLQDQPNWWFMPFLSAVVIVGGLVLIAWYWPLVQKLIQ
jgi:hypothetical protein